MAIEDPPKKTQNHWKKHTDPPKKMSPMLEQGPQKNQKPQKRTKPRQETPKAKLQNKTTNPKPHLE